MFACRIAAKEGISALTTRQVSIKRIPQSGSLFRIQVIRQFSTPSTIPQPHECSGNATGAQKRSLEKTRQSARSFQTWQPEHTCDLVDPSKPGSRAFADCEYEPLTDLFNQFAKTDHGGKVGGVDSAGTYLCLEGVRRLLTSIGERPDDETLRELFRVVDVSGDEKLHLEEFLMGADKVLGQNPARIVLVVGGPGSGKGLLCDRLVDECGVAHLSSGNLLRDEVARDTPLGRECAEIMARGDLVSSATITTLVRRRMREFPGRRVLLDGFPRSLDNAYDLIELCGKPELALHLECDDTILMERIIKRMRQGQNNNAQRDDDNIDTALRRLRTYHKYHDSTMNWLREQHVPVVNLDCSGSPESVWQQLVAIGRLMRPAAKLPNLNNRDEDLPIFGS
uniref:EF-hand domain-containing protein n=2 Tax=Ditylum brightwellii TaxID=49249 RepID=A0A6U3TGF9_9STRA|mmetsp:Transcript_13526/g.19716  ORF Transcript_13526/g.19716 Transcript_13526/m.19716 type:complete len:395 (+) Transcript_13526:96-1280(+)